MNLPTTVNHKRLITMPKTTTTLKDQDVSNNTVKRQRAMTGLNASIAHRGFTRVVRNI